MRKDEAKKSIKNIREMLRETKGEIDEARRNCVDYRLLWGVIVLIGIGQTILFLRLGLFAWISIGWIFLTGTGIFLSYRIGEREFRKTGVTTFVDRVIVKVWVSVFIGMGLIVFFAYLSPGFNFALIPPFIAILVGIALVIESALYSWRLLYFVAPLWWVGAVIMAVYPENALYFNAGLILFTYIVPALLVKVKSR